jgi:hypothetical protein
MSTKHGGWPNACQSTCYAASRVACAEGFAYGNSWSSSRADWEAFRYLATSNGTHTAALAASACGAGYCC